MMTLRGKFCKDCKIFTDEADNDALSLIYRFLDHPEFEGKKIRIMPDVHMGKDIVVGFTSSLGNSVNPNHVGGDIGCSVSTYITNLVANPEDYPEIERKIREYVKFGEEIHEQSVIPGQGLHIYLNKSLQTAKRNWPEMISQLEINESTIDKFLMKIDFDPVKFYRSIGTVGGGNHFIEIGVTPQKTYAITIHCGSRGLGQKVWTYWKTEANRRHEGSNGFLYGDGMKGYITDMVLTQAYAEYNHKIIKTIILHCINEVTGKKVKVEEEIYTPHNYIDFESQMIRKGAVAAPKDKKLLIPFNMRDGVAVCVGKGNTDWNESAPHGAGRLFSRADAKELLSMEEYEETMKGIYSTSVASSTLDESPMAYKDSKLICKLIEPTVNILYIIKPVINFKSI